MKTLNAAENGSVSVMTTRVRQVKAHAPTGNGLKMSPAMVVRNMANNCQACVVTPAGFGTAKRIRMPTDREIASGISFAPCHRRFGLIK